MGRAATGMEDDDPIAEMPTFISSLEEGRSKVSRNLPAETSSADSKVERPVRDWSRRVTGSTSRLSLDGDERGTGERSSEEEEEEDDEDKEEEEEKKEVEEKDAKGNNNNNCNGGGGERRRASAVDILRRNLGVSKSSLRSNAEREGDKGGADGDATDGSRSECDDWQKSSEGAGDAGVENKRTECDPATSDALGAQFALLTAKGAAEGSAAAGHEPCNAKEHVYCTVYCIANESRAKEITDDETAASDAPQMHSETQAEVGPSPEPSLYTLDDLVDPFGDIARHLSFSQADAEEAAVQSCWVCLEGKPIAPLPCCQKTVCDDCLKLYVTSQVRMAKPHVRCPIPECSGYLEEGLVVSHLSSEDVVKYRYFVELSQLDSSTKPCPQCSVFTTLKEHNPIRSEHKYKIQCSNCQFVWCFKCHAPWHNGLKCREYRKDDKLLRTWASVIEHGQRNAQKCPKCKIHIQRTEGCDHMKCTQCSTNFCYRCGERYRHLRFFGDHTSNLSVFGCKYRYLPDKPHLRRLIRGSICATKVLIAPVVIVLVVVIGALALVLGLVLFPVYYVCKRRKKQRTNGSRRWI